jgi:tRNA(adenine34) deaminase
MCIGAIIQSRIKKVYFLSKNEKEGAIISQYSIIDDKKLPFKVEYEYIPVKEASNLLKEFFQKKRGIK